ncbi:Synaptobrevin-like protein [Smittium culicis]|uniref:Synaptobrevin homolog YKT6 n=1 Tax=Smittium culicis TaxID=133412 RepID=A0A1R1Y8W8_9FUNG|nr:Synaptobrevin-like protein [Smittium culicis]OMJ23382.1 Synaptobrevin-like protein [Smittium culicis]
MYSIDDFLTFFATTVAERTSPGQRQGVDENNYTAFAYNRTDGLAAVVITDTEYPNRVALSLAGKLLDEFSALNPKASELTKGDGRFQPQLNKYLVDYQSPRQADVIMNVQMELDETKVVLHKTIESVLERGERLDNLVEKSNQLSDQSKMFYKTAKKTNSCCSIM